MFVSSPIPLICISLAPEFKNREDSFKVFDAIEKITTTNAETGVIQFDEELSKMIKRIPKDKKLVLSLSSFTSYYFKIIGNDELGDLFEKLMQENIHLLQSKPTPFIQYILGIYSTCLMSDLNLNNDIELPKDIKEAIKYIESNDFKVRLEK